MIRAINVVIIGSIFFTSPSYLNSYARPRKRHFLQNQYPKTTAFAGWLSTSFTRYRFSAIFKSRKSFSILPSFPKTKEHGERAECKKEREKKGNHIQEKEKRQRSGFLHFRQERWLSAPGAQEKKILGEKMITMRVECCCVVSQNRY